MGFLAGLYLSAGMGLIAAPPYPGCDQCGWYYDITRPANPYGIVELGWSNEGHKWGANFAVRHESSIATGRDHGINSAEVRIRYYPWRP